MNNPFDDKQLKDFTIADCESYLNQFPFGEHFIEVTKRLNSLKSGEIKSPEVNEGIKDTPESLHGEYQKKVIEGSGFDEDNKRDSIEATVEIFETPASQSSKSKNQEETLQKAEGSNTEPMQTTSYGQQFEIKEEQSDHSDILDTILIWGQGIVGVILFLFCILLLYLGGYNKVVHSNFHFWPMLAFSIYLMQKFYKKYFD